MEKTWWATPFSHSKLSPIMHHTPNSSAYCLYTYAHAHTHTHTLPWRLQNWPVPGSSSVFLTPVLQCREANLLWPVLRLGTNCFRLLGCSLPQARMPSCISCSPTQAPCQGLCCTPLMPHRLGWGRQPTRHTHTSHSLIFGVISKFILP